MNEDQEANSKQEEMKKISYKIKELDVQVWKLNQEKNDLKQELWSIEYGIKVGDYVIGSDDRTYLVSHFDYFPYGFPMKKDGTPSKYYQSIPRNKDKTFVILSRPEPKGRV